MRAVFRVPFLHACLALWGGVLSAQGFDPSVYARWNLPRWADSALWVSKFDERLTLFDSLNPYFQQGDFDGDGRTDIAIQVRAKENGGRGIMVIHRATGAVHLLGAGQALGNGGGDFSWLWVWRVERRSATTTPSLTARDMLFVEAPESAGGLIWWDGRKYQWTQHGD